MSELRPSLLISSPNQGGLFLLRGQVCHLLDRLDTTGLCVSDQLILRGLQSGRLYGYGFGAPTLEIDLEDFGVSDIHDVLMEGDSIYIVGTAGNEIIRLDRNFQELHRWILPGESDSWHVNCLAFWQGRIIFSAFGEFSRHSEYKGQTHRAGFVQDLQTAERIINGLSQPHSLTPLPNGGLLLANSERMELLEFDSALRPTRSKQFDRYVRGLCVDDGMIYVGLSRSRNIVDGDISGGAILVALDQASWSEHWRRNLPTAEIYDIRRLGAKHQFDTVLEILLDNQNRVELQLAKYLDCSASQLRQSDDLLGALLKIDQKISELDQQTRRHEEYIGRLEQRLKQEQARYADLCHSLDEINATMTLEREMLKTKLERTQSSLNAIQASHSWRLTAPLRTIRRELRALRARLKHRTPPT